MVINTAIHIFNHEVKAILAKGNHVSFEFYNEDNDGIVINESESLKDDKGNHHSFEWINSCTAPITTKEATQVLYDLGIMNPYIEDIELEGVTQ
ncbi:gp25 [Brochothrix phage A9]|uniref:Gp25 n=1 Tax=Brochothrix phage A9 TaxID=857312 RepID=D9J0H2_9CAUD|nr:gp25 [Brochothrix phage A9]ADJ53067.1 gp25 [Brochothrix phage A9]